MADCTAEFGLRKTSEGNVHLHHINLIIGLIDLAFAFRVCVSIDVYNDIAWAIGKSGFETSIPSAKLKPVSHNVHRSHLPNAVESFKPRSYGLT